MRGGERSHEWRRDTGDPLIVDESVAERTHLASETKPVCRTTTRHEARTLQCLKQPVYRGARQLRLSRQFHHGGNLVPVHRSEHGQAAFERPHPARFAATASIPARHLGSSVRACVRWCPDSEVRTALPHALMRTSESKGHQQINDSSVVFGFEVPMRACGQSSRNFKSTTLADCPLCGHRVKRASAGPARMASVASDKQGRTPPCSKPLRKRRRLRSVSR